MLITFSIIILILLIPIPIRFKIEYTDKKLCMYIYNIELTSKVKFNEKEDKIKNKGKLNFYFEDIKLLLHLLNKNKFKPTLRFKLNLQYGLNDAAYTAICYGLIYTLYPLIIKLLNCPFKIKKHSICIVPDFNKFILKLELSSIIFVNFAKVIYIMYLIYKVWRINQKVILSKT